MGSVVVVVVHLLFALSIFSRILQRIKDSTIVMAMAVPLNKWSTCSDVIANASQKEIIRLSQSTVVVTGANTGIGESAAAALYKIGAHVVYACRDISKAQAAAARAKQQGGVGSLTCMILDLADLQSVKDFANHFLAKSQKEDFKPLRCCVWNAGLVSSGSAGARTTKEGFEITFGVNHVGHWFLTQLLLPELRKNKPSRVIVVSSDSHYKGLVVRDEKKISDPSCVKQLAQSFDEPMMRKYGSSKLANVLFSKRLHATESKNGVYSASLHPGSMISTDIAARNNFMQTFLVKYLIGMFTKNVDQGAATTVHLCLLPHDQLQGQYFDNCAPKKSSRLTRGDVGVEAAEALEKGTKQLIRSFL